MSRCVSLLQIYYPPPPSFLAILPLMNSFVSNHLQTVAFTHAASFPVKLSPGFPVMHFSKAFSVKVFMTVWTIICCCNAIENCCMSPKPAPTELAPPPPPPYEAKLASEAGNDERSSLVKSFDSWDLFESSDPRDQNGMVMEGGLWTMDNIIGFDPLFADTDE